jgi:integrase
VELLRCLQHDERVPFRAAVLLALLCGLRLGEVGGLYFDDVNWDEATINIERALHYTPGKGNYLDLPKSDAGVRIITLPPGMLLLLRSAQEYHTEVAALIGDRWHGDGRIICSWDGGPLHHDTPSKWFRAFADKHGFEDITFHQLRATHASLLFANNLDAIAVATRMGHSDPATTLRNYGASYRLRDQQAAEIMQSLLNTTDKT